MKIERDKYGVETQTFYLTNCKMVKSGCLLEFSRYGKSIMLGKMAKRKDAIKRTRIKISLSHEDILNASARRAKKMIKRLIYANSFYWFKDNGKPYLPTTITLTFAENIQNLKVANYEFTKFIRRLNYEANKIEGKDLKQSNLKYLAVFELQKRGAIHYHCIFFNLPFINNIYDRLRDIWGQGMINVGGKKRGLNRIKNHSILQSIISYFIKYIQKSIFEDYFPNQKKYITSKDLIKPQVLYVEEVINLVKDLLPDETFLFKYDGEKDYIEGRCENSFLKWINSSQYNIAKFPVLDSMINDIIFDYSFGGSNEPKPKNDLANLNFNAPQNTELDDQPLAGLFDKNPIQPSAPDS